MNKLLGFVSVASSLANGAMLHRFLNGIAGVIALTVMTALLCTFVLLGTFVAMYFGFIHYGLDPVVAGVVVSLYMIILAAMFVILTLAKLRDLRELNLQASQNAGAIPGLIQIQSIAESFLDGFMAKDKKSAKRQI